MVNSFSPFFIFGNPRSGTSLLRLMLNSHPKIVVPPESGFVQWWFNKYQYLNQNSFFDKTVLDGFVNDILNSRKIEDWNLSKNNLTQIISNKKPRNFAEACALVYQLYGLNQKKNNFIFGDKNNYYINHMELIETIYPSAKFIHLIRDGRDVACSYIDMAKIKTDSIYKPVLPVEIEAIAKQWSGNVINIDAFMSEGNGIKIRYEDLILETEKTLLKITEFLNLEYSSEMLSYYKKENHDEPNSTIDWKLKTMMKVDKTNIYKYKHLLTQEQVNIFNSIAGTILDKNGYV